MLVGRITLSCNDLFIWGKQSAPTGFCPCCLTAWRVGTAAHVGFALRGRCQQAWLGKGHLSDEASTESVTGWAGSCAGLVSSFLTTTWGVWGSHKSILWMAEVQISDGTCPRSPGQAVKGFSCQMAQTSLCSFEPEPGASHTWTHFFLAPTCEVQVMYSPVYSQGLPGLPPWKWNALKLNMGQCSFIPVFIYSFTSRASVSLLANWG